MGSGHQFADAADQIGEPIRGLSGECFDRDDDVVDVERQRHQPASQCQRAQYGEGEQHPVSAPWRRIGIGGDTGTVGSRVGLRLWLEGCFRIGIVVIDEEIRIRGGVRYRRRRLHGQARRLVEYRPHLGKQREVGMLVDGDAGIGVAEQGPGIPDLLP